ISLRARMPQHWDFVLRVVRVRQRRRRRLRAELLGIKRLNIALLRRAPVPCNIGLHALERRNAGLLLDEGLMALAQRPIKRALTQSLRLRGAHRVSLRALFKALHAAEPTAAHQPEPEPDERVLSRLQCIVPGRCRTGCRCHQSLRREHIEKTWHGFSLRFRRAGNVARLILSDIIGSRSRVPTAKIAGRDIKFVRPPLKRRAGVVDITPHIRQRISLVVERAAVSNLAEIDRLPVTRRVRCYGDEFRSSEPEIIECRRRAYAERVRPRCRPWPFHPIARTGCVERRQPWHQPLLANSPKRC